MKAFTFDNNLGKTGDTKVIRKQRQEHKKKYFLCSAMAGRGLNTVDHQ
jgi:hypothetical protein